MGEVPEWLVQRYKSKWPKKKQTKEEKTTKVHHQKEEKEERKRKYIEDSKDELAKVAGECPTSDADLQAKRDWDLEITEKLCSLLSSPRAKKRVKQYVQLRRRTSAQSESKQALVKALSTLKEEGGNLDGGVHEDSYDFGMKKKVKKKKEKKEKAAKEIEKKKLVEMGAIAKMIATKLKNKKAKDKEAAEAAEAAAGAEPAAPAAEPE